PPTRRPRPRTTASRGRRSNGQEDPADQRATACAANTRTAFRRPPIVGLDFPPISGHDQPIHMPPPSLSPVTIAVGVTFISFGILWSVILIGIGVVLLLVG